MTRAVEGRFTILELERYREMEDDDSIYVVVRREA